MIIVLGQTATGKTRFAAHFANKIDAEIINADSRQVYKNMDLGTGKDLEEYIVDRNKITHHLIDIKEAGEKYNVFNFVQDFNKIFEKISQRQKKIIVVGGTGLYLSAVIEGYNFLEVPKNQEMRKKMESKTETELIEILKKYKTLHNSTDIRSKDRLIRAIEIGKQSHSFAKNSRPLKNNILLGLKIDKFQLYDRIQRRINLRLGHGMIEEVENLISNYGLTHEDLNYYGLEYRVISEFLKNKITYTQLKEYLFIKIRQYAKRQATWFRKMERQGLKINWIEATENLENKLKIAYQLCTDKGFLEDVKKT